jgi:hypothetical protein
MTIGTSYSFTPAWRKQMTTMLKKSGERIVCVDILDRREIQALSLLGRSQIWGGMNSLQPLRIPSFR